MKKSDLTVIEITDNHVKFLQSKSLKNGKACLVSCDVKTIQDYTDDELLGHLRNLTAGRNISSDKLNVVLPRHLVIYKSLKLPSHQEAELKKMVGLQLVNKIPYNVEDVIFDFEILQKDTNGYALVLAAVVHKDTVNRYLQLFKKLGLQVNKFVISSENILDWLNYQSKSSKDIDAQPCAVVNLDVTHTEVCFCADKKLYYSRSLNYGVRDLKSENLLELVNQIELSLQTYEKDNMGPQIHKLYIVSSLAQEIKPLAEKLENKTRLIAQSFSPLDNILCEKKINLSSLNEQMGMSLTVPAGFLVSDRKKFLNLIPQEVQETKHTTIRKRQFFQTAALLVFILVIISGYFGMDIVLKQNKLNAIKMRFQAFEVNEKKAKNKIQFVEIMDRELKGRVFVPEFFYELYRTTPRDISFRSISLNDKQQITIQGYGAIGGSVNQFQKELVKSPAFKEVNLRFATNRKIFNTEVTDFEMSAQLRKD